MHSAQSQRSHIQQLGSRPSACKRPWDVQTPPEQHYRWGEDKGEEHGLQGSQSMRPPRETAPGACAGACGPG